MTSYEQWTCDWHAQIPECDSDFVGEDQARDEGWLVVERVVQREVGSLKYPAHEVEHICAECQKDDECVARLVSRRFKGYYAEDQERLDVLIASGAAPVKGFA